MPDPQLPLPLQRCNSSTCSEDAANRENHPIPFLQKYLVPMSRYEGTYGSLVIVLSFFCHSGALGHGDDLVYRVHTDWRQRSDTSEPVAMPRQSPRAFLRRFPNCSFDIALSGQWFFSILGVRLRQSARAKSSFSNQGDSSSKTGGYFRLISVRIGACP